MRCIFCKNDSSKSKSVEHIIPESLGNTTKVLPKGIVCDTCNNYFARKVEQPFLEAPALKALRFHQVVPNKRRRVPPLTGIFLVD
jgi:HNH endonuclease